VTNTYGFSSAPSSITQKAMAAAFNLEEKERRETADLNISFYYGQQEQSLNLINDDVDPVILNLTKPIIQKRCSLLYSRPLVREWEGPAGSIAAVEQVYKDVSIDALLQQADLYAELTGSSLIHPYPRDDLPGGLGLRIYDATAFSVLGNDDDPATADSVDLLRVVDRLVDPKISGRQMPQVERVLNHQIWTSEAVVFYEGEQLIASEPNIYGFLPFVNFCGEEVLNQYVGWPIANLIRQLNNHINQLLTHLSFTIKMQAGTPIVLSGFSSGETVVVHPGRALNIPSGAAADVLSLNPKIEETLATVKYLEDRIYSSSAVPKISIEGGDADKTHISGTQLLVRWYPLMGVFYEKSVRYERYELQLANMICAILDLPAIEAINVIWPEERMLPFSPQDETLERDIALNIVTPVEEVRRRQPGLTENEAEAELQANKAINEQNQPDPVLQEVPSGAPASS